MLIVSRNCLVYLEIERVILYFSKIIFIHHVVQTEGKQANCMWTVCLGPYSHPLQGPSVGQAQGQTFHKHWLFHPHSISEAGCPHHHQSQDCPLKGSERAPGKYPKHPWLDSQCRWWRRNRACLEFSALRHCSAHLPSSQPLCQMKLTSWRRKSHLRAFQWAAQDYTASYGRRRTFSRILGWQNLNFSFWYLICRTPIKIQLNNYELSTETDNTLLVRWHFLFPHRA